MKKQRLEKPSEVIFPEVKQKAQYLERICPDCGNNRFKILGTIHKAEGTKAGHYRVECTLCKFQEAAIGKQPYGIKQTDHKRGKVPQRPSQDNNRKNSFL